MSDNDKNGRKYVSHHILPTSSNLLGLCFVILSLMKVLKVDRETIIDELIAVAILLFLVASVLSYASMRSDQQHERYERAADIFFLTGLVVLSIISVIVVFVVI
jgi:multisubunit Na+/H+ antiporter MnhG subunit